ncbi:TonB-dependent receptor [Caulobacter sp.]|uniref:TonB-dependent receptor n=1 Tax=Caulobacter sp. TaxID=78 RepID=UPI002B4755CA|nr:TonB-dependent receptor [Caulobacter sp.]HJV40070.1 TonB-dependent receptor [Caulobacter sp.]
MSITSKPVVWAASALALGLGVEPAIAQSTDPNSGATVDALVVSGNRQVDTPSDTIKRRAPGVVDSITARDIARLPDTTLAEALDRVVGVSSDKFTQTSEAGSTTVRGFDARYNSMDIDGNPIWFTSQNNRGAQLAIFPASIVNQVNVFKTVTPDQDANAVGGHISLRTLRAFDGGSKPYLSLGARVGAYDQDGSGGQGGPSYRFYGAGKTTFGAEGKFGAVLGFDSQRTRNFDRYVAVDGYSQVSGSDQVNGGVYQGKYDKDIRRNAAYGKLEARANDRLYAFLSANVFDEHTKQYLQRSGVYIYQTSGRTTDYSNGKANFNKAVGQTKEYDYDIKRQAAVLGGGVDYQLGARGVLALRGNYTDYDYDVDLRYPETFQMSGLSGSYDVSGDRPSASVSTTGFGDPANWVYRNTSASYQQFQRLSDKVYALRADYDFNSGHSARGLGFKAGAAWTRLDRDYDQAQDNYKLPTGMTLRLSQVAPAGSSVADNSAMENDWSAFWAAMRSNGVLTRDDQATADYRLTEDVTSGYASMSFTGDRYRLLTGLRYEHTRFDNDTADIINGVTKAATRHRGYDNWLPNAQASFDVTDKLRLRAAFTKTLARADFSDFAMGRTTTLDSLGNPVIKGTNPNLNPRQSTNYDLAAEYYFQDGFASIGVFRKDLHEETFTQRTQQFDAAGVAILTEEVPLNTGAARVKGLEVSLVKRRFESLPGLLKGLGFNANYTYLDGRWDVVFTDGTRRGVDGLRNQPRWLANVMVSYDAGPLDLNLAWRLRGRTFTGTFGTSAEKDVWIDRYEQLDLQANFVVRHGLRLFAEARNLTNQDWRQTTGATDVVAQAVNPGRSYFVGVKYRY